jgi:hypothetical protein
MISLFKKLFFKNDISSKGICSICGKEFKDSELHLHNTLAFCSNDLKEFKSNEWVVVIDTKSDPENPEAALYTQNIKDLLLKKSISSFITVSYESKDDIIFSIFKLSIPQDKLSEFQRLNLPNTDL